MRVGAVVLRLRWKETRFKNYVAGAAEMAAAMTGTLLQQSLFVVPLADEPEANVLENEVQQRVMQRFAVVVALKNDINQGDKYGIIAHDQLHDIRNEIFDAILGWEMPDGESTIAYAGGRLLQIDPAWMYWQFEFEYRLRIVKGALEEYEVETQSQFIWDLAKQIALEEAKLAPENEYSGLTAEQIKAIIPEEEVAVTWESIYMQLIESPNAELPYTGDMPKADGFPDVSLPDMANWIDMTKHPEDGAFGRGFAAGYDDYTGD